MKINRFKKNGYSSEVAKRYVEDKDIYFVSSFPEVQFKYENDQRTNEITGYKYYFLQEGLNPFIIKFEDEIKELPPFLSKVTIENLEGIEIRSNVYFKAQSITVAK
ncbi:hypothetical protein G5S33_00865 [Staphylococcus cohnii subsp. cohnii]|uniref:hypothetical protein n=1 Tax=Staphylococcus cohnii TaxID=29382 RepID=UPI0015FF5BD2|nr:hypothetical protein [Staphylococcus cohnii]MBB2507474.1 hypothetical protein [Staphylococcus cohnii subsp. barensis]